jgi:predicted Zn finger-like uncharacterized protein
MNVACPSCKTRYQVDDARVPPTGVTIRCPKCSHSFLAKRPDAPGAPPRAATTAVPLPGSAPVRPPPPQATAPQAPAAAPQQGQAVPLPGQTARAVPLPGNKAPAAPNTTRVPPRAASAVALPGSAAPGARIPAMRTDPGVGELDLGLDDPPPPSRAPNPAPPVFAPRPAAPRAEPSDLPGPRPPSRPAPNASVPRNFADAGVLDFIDGTASRAGAGPSATSAQVEYKVRRRNGRIEGPFGLNRLVTMVRNREFQGSEDLSEDGVSWRAMSSIPELNRVITELAAAADPFAFGNVDLSGAGGRPGAPAGGSQGLSDLDLGLDDDSEPFPHRAPRRPAPVPREEPPGAESMALVPRGETLPELPSVPGAPTRRDELEVGEIPELPPFWKTYKTPIIFFSAVMGLLLIGVFTHLFTPYGAFGIPALVAELMKKPPPPAPTKPPPPPAKVVDLKELAGLIDEGAYEAFRSVFATVQQSGPSVPDNMLALAKARGFATLAYGPTEFPLAELQAAVQALNTIDLTRALGGNTAAANLEMLKARVALQLLDGQAEAAKEKLTQVFEQQSGDKELALLLGLAHARLGERLAALVALDKALVIDPNYAPALHAIADVVRKGEGRESLEEALEWYHKALRAEPSHTRSALAAAEVYAALHRVGGRRAVMREAAPRVSRGLPPAQISEFLFQTAKSHDELGELPSVADYAFEAARLDPANGAYVALAALAKAARKAAPEALTMLESVLARSPTDVEALLTRARIHSQGDDVAKAFVDLDAARAAAPKDARVPLWEGRFNVALAKLPDARSALERAVKLDETQADARVDLGLLELSLGDIDSAFAQAEAAVKTDEYSARARALLGDCYAWRGQLDEAQKTYKLALELDQGLVGARLGYANALRDLGARSMRPGKTNELAQSIPLYLSALAEHPSDPRVLFEYGRALELQGQVVAALELYREAAQLDAKDVRPHLKMVSAYMEQPTPDTAAAKASLERARTIEMGSGRQVPDVGYWEARIAFAEGRVHDAVGALRLAVEAEEKNAVYAYWLARALERNNSLYEAISYFEKAISLNSRYAAAHRALGWTAVDRNQFDRAREAFNRYREAAPEDSTIYVDIGETYTRQNRDEEAMKAFQRALQDHPDHVQALLQVGNILGRRGEDDQAARFYERAAKADDKAGEAWCQLGIALARKKLGKPGRDALDRCLALENSPEDMKETARGILEANN